MAEYTFLLIIIQDGISSLMLAARAGNEEVVERLLLHGAVVDLQNIVSVWISGIVVSV